jgi:multidrug efflux system outer membrane protein
VEADARLEAANAGVGAARAEFLPHVEYMVGYGLDTDTLGTDVSQHLGLVAGVTLTVPIFDWGIGTRSVDAAKLSTHQAQVARDQAARGERVDLATAVSSARSAARRSEGLAASLSDAERNVAISQARYTAGEADLLEVTEAQQTLGDTRYASNTALAEYQSALGHLRLLAGQ